VSSTDTGAAREHFFVLPGRALVLGIALLAAVALIALAVPMEPLAIDRAWSDAMESVESPALKEIALVFNALGRGWGWALTLAAVAGVLLVRRRIVALVAFVAAEALSSFLSALLKALVGRPRPPDGVVHPVGSSFPSGHASYGAVTCIALVLLFTAPERRARWWGLAALGIAGMAWSRTYLQVHWLSDVIGGVLLGAGIVLTTFAAAQLVGSKRQGHVDRPAGKSSSVGFEPSSQACSGVPRDRPQLPPRPTITRPRRLHRLNPWNYSSSCPAYGSCERAGSTRTRRRWSRDAL
jgi:undecaprenyl-diphosphatase